MYKQIAAKYDTITNHADIWTHNGFVTVYNTRTGRHETFHVHTDKKSGVRTISAVTKYLSKSVFATINPDGSWRMLSRIRGSLVAAYEARLKILMHPECGIRKGLEYRMANNCRRCNAILTHPDSIVLGIGPCCRAHLELDEVLAHCKTLCDHQLVGFWRSHRARGEHEIANIAWACIDNPDLKEALRVKG